MKIMDQTSFNDNIRRRVYSVLTIAQHFFYFFSIIYLVDFSEAKGLHAKF